MLRSARWILLLILRGETAGFGSQHHECSHGCVSKKHLLYEVPIVGTLGKCLLPLYWVDQFLQCHICWTEIAETHCMSVCIAFTLTKVHIHVWMFKKKTNAVIPNTLCLFVLGCTSAALSISLLEMQWWACYKPVTNDFVHKMQSLKEGHICYWHLLLLLEFLNCTLH